MQNEEFCAKLISDTLDKYGKIDVLVCNAAYQNTHAQIDEWSTSEFDRTYKTNVYAMFWLCRAALPRMKPGSSIITLGSIQSYEPGSSLLAYASTKGELHQKSFQACHGERRARELRSTRSRLDAAYSTSMPKRRIEKFGQDETTFSRPAQPAEIAPIFTFLASYDARYLTGETITITGGKTPL